MKRTLPLLVTALIILTLPAHSAAQTPMPVRPDVPSLQALLTSTPGPLTLATHTTGSGILLLGRSTTPRPVAAMQFHRPDWEFGRAWLGALIGTGYAYIFDLVIHSQTDFSKGNMLLDEEPGYGEVVYNVLLYAGIPPYFSLGGLEKVIPRMGSRWGGYLGGVVGSLLGLAYWTDQGDVRSFRGGIVMTVLTALGTQIGYHIF